MEGFGQKLRRSRKRAKLSAREASEISGVSEAYIYKLEKNARENPSLDVVVKLAESYKDPSLTKDYMIMNNITDVQIDVSLSVEKERLLQELTRQDSQNTIARTLFDILKNDEKALDEWTKTVNAFIDKHKKPNDDKSE